jgi:hypothetical protein
MDPRILAAYLLMREPLMLVGSKHVDPIWRKCILCGQPRNHNNSFCSAACCKAYKEKKRNEAKQ